MPLPYGGNVAKAHVGRWSEDCPEHAGVIMFDSNEMPLGFGVATKSAAAAQRAAPIDTVCARQADCGEYLREEDALFAA